MPKTLLIDFDGVLNTYCGNFSESQIPAPRNGVKEFLQILAKTYKIEIFTVRNKKLTYEWLKKYQLDEFIHDITNVKNPYASVILDDRALRFDGDFDKALAEILNFTPYWKNL